MKTSLLICLALALGTLSHLGQEAMVRLHGNLSPAVARGSAIERVAGDELIRFSLALPVHNQAGLDALLHSLYTPGDPLYHKFLKTGEFASRFGPAQEDYDSVLAFAKASGFQIIESPSNRLVLGLAATSAQIEKAFNVRMMRFRETSGRVFHAPDAEPMLPVSVASKVSGVIGLDNALEPKSNLRPQVTPPSAGSSGIGSGPGQGVAPSDITAAYNLNGVAEQGAGQTLALFELDGYLPSDIQGYEANFGLPNVPLQNVLLDGLTTNSPSAITNLGPVEVTLDIELAIAAAPGLAKIIVYEGTSFVTIYNRIASDNAAQQVSTSWYAGQESNVSSSIRNSENTAFQQMASQGQSFYAASGDFGSNVKIGTSNGTNVLQFGVQDPSSQQWVTGVGGTTLATAGPGGAYVSETAWSGSGGGISTIWGLPNYQSSVVSPGSGGSATARNVPDVCLNSDPKSGYSIYFNGAWLIQGGTSCAAPIWAAFNALVNQRRASHGATQLGFLNPTLYYLAHTGNYHSDFHDITSGNNGTYAAVQAYDNCTGYGSFNAPLLLNDLQIDADVLYVDGTYAGSSQNGTLASPYKTVAAALNAASSAHPTLIYIKGSAYLENVTFHKTVALVNNGGGNVTVGN